MAKKLNWYGDEFKADAIRMVREANRSVYSVAKDLGINSQISQTESTDWTSYLQLYGLSIQVVAEIDCGKHEISSN